MHTLLEGLIVLGVLVGAMVLGEVPAVRAWAQMVDDQRGWLLPLMIGAAVTGFLILLWGWVRVGLVLGQPMTHKEVERLAARTQILGPDKRFSKARLWGKTRGVQVPEMTWTFQEMKSAWRDGSWLVNAGVRRKFVITAGGILCILGFFAALLVAVGPASVKLFLGGALLYASIRLTYGFWQA